MNHAPLASLSGSRRGFSIMEALVTLGIIALLAGLVFAAIRHAKSAGDVVSERAMVVALRNSCEQFKSEFGFPVPLVMDAPDTANPATGNAPAEAPTPGVGRMIVWSTADLANPDTTANGSVAGDANYTLRKCYSQLSLPYYICGSLDDIFDEVNGLGFTAPEKPQGNFGMFSRRGRKHEALFDPTQFKTRTGTVRYHGPVTPFQNTDAALVMRAKEMYILYRGFPNANADIPIRYYRWLPSYYPPNDPKKGLVKYWNVPIAVGGDALDGKNPPQRGDLKGVEWAIVSPGPDGLFGDEPSLTTPNERLKAAADNIVEVGR